MEDFLNYSQALALKKLGYNEPSYALFFNKSIEINFSESQLEKDSIIQAPTHQQAFRLFRTKYNLLGGVYSNASGYGWEIHDNIGGTHRYMVEDGDCELSGMYTTFEKAESACIDKLIEVCKKD